MRPQIELSLTQSSFRMASVDLRLKFTPWGLRLVFTGAHLGHILVKDE